ncbi:hypothetical protein B9Z55_028480 [Caenorhabditis nigoni]|uniref:Uncharacterized protein n=1 Tax=Caenorhabditis nigoni TaxID=1611254 RepID=A0A2G5SBC4_9PELO|nr:hypothetical protein B9Z55_028480 [Caenorhabditis nigoni]
MISRFESFLQVVDKRIFFKPEALLSYGENKDFTRLENWKQKKKFFMGKFEHDDEYEAEVREKPEDYKMEESEEEDEKEDEEEEDQGKTHEIVRKFAYHVLPYRK